MNPRSIVFTSSLKGYPNNPPMFSHDNPTITPFVHPLIWTLTLVITPSLGDYPDNPMIIWIIPPLFFHMDNPLITRITTHYSSIVLTPP